MHALSFIAVVAWFGSLNAKVVQLNNDGTSSDCLDSHESCQFWSSIGECEKNPGWMLPNCRQSCNSCDYESLQSKMSSRKAQDVEEDVPDVVCAENDNFCKARKIAAIVPKGSNQAGTARVVDKNQCKDRHAQCVNWKKEGECSINPGWMIVNCPASCDACHLLNPALRCSREHLNMTAPPAYEPGQMNQMFSQLHEKYNDLYGITILSEDPWVVTFDNFISNDEADALIAQQKKWERSTDSGSSNEYGETGRILSQGRTSSNSWCNRGCESHPSVDRLISKIETVVGVPRTNYESFQVLRYELGQKYITHHDYGAEDKKKVCGPRVLTFFLYLSDVEQGGETAFPLLNISVTPKKGKALLWPSTLDSDPTSIDSRTMHEAKPVIKGLKFAANSWIHLHDFMKPNLWGCTGSFDEL